MWGPPGLVGPPPLSLSSSPAGNINPKARHVQSCGELELSPFFFFSPCFLFLYDNNNNVEIIPLPSLKNRSSSSLRTQLRRTSECSQNLGGPIMTVEAETATVPELALADTDINWDRLDKARFHIIGAILFTAQSALLHPTAVVKTRMQVAGSGLSRMHGVSVFRHILRADGIPGIFRGFGTSAIGSLPGRVLALTSLEVSKDMMLKYTEGVNMPEASRVGLANGVAGMLSNLVSSVYYVPLDVVCQRLMVQGLPGSIPCNGPTDVVHKVMRVEGFRGLYRGFGLTAITLSPASALWWGAYGSAQHIIWRSVGYNDDMDQKPSHVEMVTVQATAGLLAGACSSVITTPVDTVKTRLQVMDNYGVGRPSILKTAKTLLEEDGWWGFYRGFGPRFLNMSLYGTTMIVTYELIKRLSVKRD